MRAKQEVKNWLLTHYVKDATIEQIDRWLNSVYETKDEWMNSNLSISGDTVTFQDVMDFVNSESKQDFSRLISPIKETLLTLVSQIKMLEDKLNEKA